MRTQARSKILISVVAAVVLIYVCSIFTVNIWGRGYVNFDIYSDGILAKYIALEKSLFPEGWHFGNQIYTIATPVVASLFYILVGDSYLALALASCLMTVLCIISFLWCVKPFSKPKSIIPALMVLLGGTNIGLSAHGDMEGLQVFYTMASYYSCYIIVIFATLGVYFRLLNRIPVNIFVVLSVLTLNFALGIQSLRETLVLNLPLCTIALFEAVLSKRSTQRLDSRYIYSTIFAFVALFVNVVGVIVNNLLVSKGIILQNDILEDTSPLLWDNVSSSFCAFLNYIGLGIPSGALSLFECAGALFSVIIVITTVVFVLNDYFKHKQTIIGVSILYFVISLIAVFFSGLFFIHLRPIYFFCWYLLVSFCVIYLLELEWMRRKGLLDVLKSLLVVGLLCVSLANYLCTFLVSFKGINETWSFYQEIVKQLNADGIKYIYSDWRTERNMISSMSNDEIVYATMKFSNTPDDLWEPLDYLYLDSWFDPRNFENAYIILTNYSSKALESDFSSDYKTVFMSNLELVHTFESNDIIVYLYSGSEKMFRDMIE